jgi:hypothetical protein
MSVRPLLTACLLLAGLSGLSRADDKQQDEQRLREEVLKLRESLVEQQKRLLELQQRAVENEKKALESEKRALEATRAAVEQREQAVRELEKLQKERAELAEQKNQERKARIQSEIELKVLRARTLELETQLRELNRELLKAKAGGGGVPVRPRDDNPPPDNLDGRVKQVDAEGGLLVITIGSDHGLSQGHTLHVYRLSPKPEETKYLGKVEVLAARPQESVVRWLGKPPVPPRPGDRVASKLQVPEKKPDDKPAPKPPAPENPPQDNVEGKVLRVDEKTGLLTLSVGSDAGVKQGHTLKVFRIDPDVPANSKYLGVVEVVEVTARTAVARVRTPPPSRLPLRAGDQVATSILSGR